MIGVWFAYLVLRRPPAARRDSRSDPNWFAVLIFCWVCWLVWTGVSWLYGAIV